MTTYLIVMLTVHLVLMVWTIFTKPGAPRPPNPGTSGLMVAVLIHASMAAWAVHLLLEVKS